MAWKLYEGNCFDHFHKIEDHSIDMILCDPPYGATQNNWDSTIPLNPLWEEYKRIIKDNGAILLFGCEPFSSKLRLSNLAMYRYDWIWHKTRAGGFLNASRMPLISHELISVFYKKLPTYNPQMEKGEPYTKKTPNNGDGRNYGNFNRENTTKTNEGYRFPRSVISFSNNNYKSLHPTQKPLELFEYLIKTYTNEGDLVLDNCAGSGTTGVAAEITGRNSILMEKKPEYCQIIKDRLSDINLDQYQPQRTHIPLTDF
ncbi:site-specific DNA-methyltransferase [candidate division WWE3 bacterium]|uniref:Methyltransferase n=1 Tax=candidate division WWE3 bacterium TaxID=2053526 RepID=A0A7X9E683_UNCKA|nr:site-specific DNA-methyltransferase [candidate division WWE3 bacterium]